MSYIRILKLIYLADKTHLEDYGRTISADSYLALDNGMVPEKIFFMLKSPEQNSDFGIVYSNIIALRPANTNHLSESDINVLKRTIALYESLPNWHLYQLSRDGVWSKTIADNTDTADMVDLIDEVDIPEGYLMEYLLDNTHPVSTDGNIIKDDLNVNKNNSSSELPPEDNLY